MPTDVISTIGQTSSPTTPTFSTLQAWEDASPTNLTTSRSNTTITGATSSTIILDAGASGTTDFYVGHPVWADARASEKRMITAYNGTTKIATIGAFNGSNATWDNIPTIEAYTIDSVRYIGECLDQGKFTAVLIIAGSTTDATRYTILRCASGASFKDKSAVRTTALLYNSTTGSGVAVEPSSGAPTTISISESYAQVAGIQVQRRSYGYCFGGTAGLAIVISQCIVSASNRHEVYIDPNFSIVNVTYRNCLFLRDHTSDTWSTPSKFYGCTFVTVDSVGGAALTSAYSTLLLKNCAVFGFTTAVSGTSAAGSDYNATDAAGVGGTGSHNLTSLAFASQFISTTTDFRAASGGSLQAGTPDATNTPADITGLTRDATTPWIGCWEVAAVASGGGVIGGGVGGGAYILGC